MTYDSEMTQRHGASEPRADSGEKRQREEWGAGAGRAPAAPASAGGNPRAGGGETERAGTGPPPGLLRWRGLRAPRHLAARAGGQTHRIKTGLQPPQPISFRYAHRTLHGQHCSTMKRGNQNLSSASIESCSPTAPKLPKRGRRVALSPAPSASLVLLSPGSESLIRGEVGDVLDSSFVPYARSSPIHPNAPRRGPSTPQGHRRHLFNSPPPMSAEKRRQLEERLTAEREEIYGGCLNYYVEVRFYFPYFEFFHLFSKKSMRINILVFSVFFSVARGKPALRGRRQRCRRCRRHPEHLLRPEPRRPRRRRHGGHQEHGEHLQRPAPRRPHPVPPHRHQGEHLQCPAPPARVQQQQQQLSSAQQCSARR